jgi:hypothetical protein
MNARNKALLYLIISVLLCFGCNVCQNERSGDSIEYIGITGRTEEERINGSRRTAGGINKTLVWRSRDK